MFTQEQVGLIAGELSTDSTPALRMLAVDGTLGGEYHRRLLTRELEAKLLARSTYTDIVLVMRVAAMHSLLEWVKSAVILCE